MKLSQISRFITLNDQNCQYRFLPSGDIYDFSCHSVMANSFRGNARDGSLNNIWLRVGSGEEASVFPLLGIASGSSVSHNGRCLVQSGVAGGISYRVTFRPVGDIWFWDVELEGSGQTVDLVYGQDTGVSSAGGILTNELYNAQYLGHTVFETENGFVVCSRNNMGGAMGANNYMQQGVLGAKALHYSTDGLQFFGLSSKETQQPKALGGDLEDVNLQNEFAYIALQTEKLHLTESRKLSFYGLIRPDHPEAITSVEFREELMAAWNAPVSEEGMTAVAPVKVRAEFGAPLSSLSYTEEEIAAMYPCRELTERGEGKLLSFFTPDHAHVVTKEKELMVERPHGTIIITPPDTQKVNSALISSTHYIYGVFNSHVVAGNTDVHKLICSPRNTLNLVRTSGQRLYVRLDGQYRMFILPGLFEMGMNYTRWYYKTEGETFVITSYTMASGCGLRMEVKALSGKAYDYLLTTQLSLGAAEQARDIVCEELENGLRFPLHTPQYPELFYEMRLSENAVFSDDRVFFQDGRACDETLLTTAVSGKNGFSLSISAWLEAPDAGEKAAFDAALRDADFETQKAAVQSYYDALTRDFRLELPENADEALAQRVRILNHTSRWYAHNAMIHYSMPHGLEQPGGAAWGARDICQGPMEFFLATAHYDVARDILLNFFAHQNTKTQEWPQWFMFDRYSINAGECHGDVIFWPLKAVADYLEATGDTGILEEEVGYDDAPHRKETILRHIAMALDNIRSTRLIADTGLITYAGGDWDDTLQPASEELKKQLVSAWTEALAYQAFHKLSQALSQAAPEMAKELAELAQLTRQAFDTYLIRDGVIAGFLMHGEENLPMLHPSDEKTGIHYRLLPMTRSIIAELVDPEQANRNTELIQQKLKCPDGVRLMDKPAGYNGGVSRLFRRAEQAANVGREISLQYVHAHIRYIEAMAKLGRAREAWNSLFVINPMMIQATVPNAVVRQSNLYFSSSEGCYRDRYEYAEKFHLLKTGSIPVKGGWRLYSSGPGIYTNQLVSNVLGIRFRKEGLVLDPTIPEELDGLHLTYTCFGRKLTFVYRTGHEEVRAVAGGKALEGRVLANPYRRGGLLIPREVMEACADEIEIFC